MRRASSLRFILVLSGALLPLAACSRAEPQIIVNRSSHPVRIVIGYPRYEISPGKPVRCRYEDGGMRMGPEGIRDPGSYSDVKFLAQDSSRCEVTFELPAGYQVTVDISGTCSDYAELVASNPAVEPWPNFLRVDGVQGTIELRGWQVAQYFTRQRNESCLLVYQ